MSRANYCCTNRRYFHAFMAVVNIKFGSCILDQHLFRAPSPTLNSNAITTFVWICSGCDWNWYSFRIHRVPYVVVPHCHSIFFYRSSERIAHMVANKNTIKAREDCTTNFHNITVHDFLVFGIFFSALLIRIN